jgi:hypothetical protein
VPYGPQAPQAGYDPYAHWSTPAPVNPYAAAPQYVPIEDKKDEEVEALKEQIEALRVQALEEETLRRELEAIREESRRQLELVQQQLTSKGTGEPTVMDKMLEMQMVQAQQAQARVEQERLDREMRWREEQVLRREDSQLRQEEWKRDKEKQEDQRREEQRREDARRKDSEKHFSQMLEMSLGQKQTPDQMLGMLKTLVDMQPKQDATEQVMGLAQAALTMRDLFGGNSEQEGKWESIIKTGGEALSRAIGQVQANRQPQPAMVPAPQIQQLPPPQQQLTPEQARARAAYQAQAQAQQRVQAAAQAARAKFERDPSPAEWGQILAFTVDAHDNGSPADDAATHLYTMVVRGMQLPKAVERLAAATTDELRMQLSFMGLAPEIAASPFKAKIDRVLALLETQEGTEWIGELLASIREIYEEVTGEPQQADAGPQGSETEILDQDGLPIEAAEPEEEGEVAQATASVAPPTAPPTAPAEVAQAAPVVNETPGGPGAGEQGQPGGEPEIPSG